MDSTRGQTVRNALITPLPVPLVNSTSANQRDNVTSISGYFQLLLQNKSFIFYIIIDNSKEVDESDELISDYTSDTTFFDEESVLATPRGPAAILGSLAGSSGENMEWEYSFHKLEGKVHIFFEWIAKTKSYRLVVIGE